MQETAKVNYVQYGKSTKCKKGKKSTQSGASSHRGNRGHGMSSKPSGKGKKFPFPQDTCYSCQKGRHQKVQDCKASLCKPSSKPSGKGKKFPFPQDTCYRCGKGRHQKVQDCKAVDMMCRGCGKKGHFEKVCLKGKHSTHSLEVPQASTSTAGAGAGEPLYFNDEGQTVYMYMVSFSM